MHTMPVKRNKHWCTDTDLLPAVGVAEQLMDHASFDEVDKKIGWLPSQNNIPWDC